MSELEFHITSDTLDMNTIPTVVVILGTTNYVLIMTLGNGFHYGIIFYEKFGGDPKKRSIGNQLVSFACSGVIFHTVVTGSIFTLYSWIGPLGSSIATIALFARIAAGLAIALSFTELILYKCFMVFNLKIALGLNDDLFALFIKLCNVLSVSVIAGSHIFLGNVNGRTYVFLSGDQITPLSR